MEILFGIMLFGVGLMVGMVIQESADKSKPTLAQRLQAQMVIKDKKLK